jgi:hypothetical protein
MTEHFLDCDPLSVVHCQHPSHQVLRSFTNGFPLWCIQLQRKSPVEHIRLKTKRQASKLEFTKIIFKNMRFYVLTIASIWVMVLWDMTPCSLAGRFHKRRIISQVTELLLGSLLHEGGGTR